MYKVQTEQLSYVIIYIHVNNYTGYDRDYCVKFSTNILTILFVVLIATEWILNYVDIVLMIFN